jgi:hypothetical protein
MKNLLKVTAAILTALAWAASAAAAECTPLPPKDLEGSIAAMGPARVSLAASYFQQNGCNWNGNDQLNGTDAYVFDATGIEGPAVFTVTLSGTAAAFEGIVLDEGCAKLGDTLTFGSGAEGVAEPYVVTIPTGAKWIIVQGSTTVPVQVSTFFDVNIKLHFDGKVCEVVKKKKKRRH